ncbi:hypothetical protein DFH08DRAFT_871729 [Mycena albidolilacea]|uniref:Uncharacterized protein n=1 Tax=Mycena albidolilacea TaxID=1033008 RepID=A0AAD6ZWQ3_9AGAR|nr:hypothetical protein DFH08DRAFT_871729 [Mycena albidolilacea]
MGLSSRFNSSGNDSHLTQFELRPADGTQAHRDALITAFMFLQIFGGHLGIPIVLLTTVFSKTIQRRPVLINFLVTWVIYATAYTLLLYTGKQTGPEPPKPLCIAQAAFVYGATVMTSAAGLAFVIHLWFSLKTGKKMTGRWHILLLLSPYILFVAFSITMLVAGSQNSETISRSRSLFYCSISLHLMTVVPATTAVIMAAVVVFEVLICVRLYRHRRAFRNMARTNTGAAPLDLLIRVGIFSLYSLLAFVACIAFWVSTGDLLPYIILASLPTVAFLMFGTQGDLLRAWGITAAVRSIFRLFLRQSRPETSILYSTRRQGTLDTHHVDVLHMDTISANDSEKHVEIV